MNQGQDIDYFRFISDTLSEPEESTEQAINEEDSFPAQWRPIQAIINREHNAFAWMCSRRAGKTDGTSLLTAVCGQRFEGYRILYIHNTREVAKQQFFEPLRELLEEKGIPEIDHNLAALNVTFGKRCFVQVRKTSGLREKSGIAAPLGATKKA